MICESSARGNKGFCLALIHLIAKQKFEIPVLHHDVIIDD